MAQTASSTLTAPISATSSISEAFATTATISTSESEVYTSTVPMFVVESQTDTSTKPVVQPGIFGTVWVLGRPDARPRIAGSAHVVDEAKLKKFAYTDVHNVLGEVPGVYVRGEEGYGLRPNIGFRGANSDRSAKVTLLEDGILLGPAPYSAAAAYYFPMMPRVVGVEVFKGPAAIKQGPQTIGGAINFQTRPVPRQLDADLDLAFGLNRLGKAHGAFGYGTDRWGLVLEGAHLQTTGFKDLDNGEDTGFTRTDLMLKGRLNTEPTAPLYHQLELKLGFGDEVSNETYLGLASSDFSSTPYRRYIGSAEDQMRWHRWQGQVGYLFSSALVQVRVTAYRHDLARNWRRLNALGPGAPTLSSVLANPTGRNAIYYAMLTGQEDSDPTDPSQSLIVTNNQRDFVSQGIAAVSEWRMPKLFDALSQRLELGARLHHDFIERDHTEDSLLVLQRTLVPVGEARTATKNRGESLALALHALDDLAWGDLHLTPGLRLELIRNQFIDRLTSNQLDRTQTALLPGLGAYYQLTPWLGLLGGAYVGFSAVSPGQPEEVLPERATNYEAGARLVLAKTKLELIGYLSDYANLTGECTFSGGCVDDAINAQFSGGKAWVYGLEATFGQELPGPWSTKFRLELAYTLTLTEFRTAFASTFPQWGNVEIGDELPYVPRHQLGGSASLEHQRFELNLAFRWVSAMRDQAGQGPTAPGERTDPYGILDLTGSYHFSPNNRVYLRAENLLDADYIVSLRPFGARPGPPLQAQIGYAHHFD